VNDGENPRVNDPENPQHTRHFQGAKDLESGGPSTFMSRKVLSAAFAAFSGRQRS
jgi:hypothetical protein